MQKPLLSKHKLPIRQQLRFSGRLVREARNKQSINHAHNVRGGELRAARTVHVVKHRWVS
jgi:hypothetical protein